MGVQISQLFPKKEVELAELAGKKIAIDAYNSIHAFLSIIRDRFTGEPLKDSRGRITSHLSGLLYRNANLIENGISTVWVFDGKPPEFKQSTIEAREEVRKQAKRKWEEAVAKGEEAIKYAQAAVKVTEEMVQGSKQLLDAMGIPWVQAPSEGEAGCSHFCKKGFVYAVGSQDADALLFGAPRLIRNLSISGRRKIPKKDEFMEIKPELIELQSVLDSLGINQRQLIMLGILVGTDYNPRGVEGVGPKTAVKLVKEHKTLSSLMKNVEWRFDVGAEEIFDFFLNPPVAEVGKHDFKWGQPDAEKIMRFMSDEHDFSAERIQKVIDRLQQGRGAVEQKSLKGWFGK